MVCISETCEFLSTLGLYNCIFGEIFGILPILTPHHQIQMDNVPGVELKMQPLLDLERLAIVSECFTKVRYCLWIKTFVIVLIIPVYIHYFTFIWQYLVILIGAALNVKFITIGSLIDMNDNSLEEILAHNKLNKLQELKISKGSGLTIKSLYSLLEDCPNLVSIKGIEYWEGVSKKV